MRDYAEAIPLFIAEFNELAAKSATPAALGATLLVAVEIIHNLAVVTMESLNRARDDAPIDRAGYLDTFFRTQHALIDNPPNPSPDG